MKKRIITIVAILSLLMYLPVQIVSATDIPELDAETIKKLWDGFWFFDDCYPLNYFYDVDDYQNGYPHVVFDRDSKGRQYANEKNMNT